MRSFFAARSPTWSATQDASCRRSGRKSCARGQTDRAQCNIRVPPYLTMLGKTLLLCLVVRLWRLISIPTNPFPHAAHHAKAMLRDRSPDTSSNFRRSEGFHRTPAGALTSFRSGRREQLRVRVMRSWASYSRPAKVATGHRSPGARGRFSSLPHAHAGGLQTSGCLVTLVRDSLFLCPGGALRRSSVTSSEAIGGRVSYRPERNAPRVAERLTHLVANAADIPTPTAFLKSFDHRRTSSLLRPNALDAAHICLFPREGKVVIGQVAILLLQFALQLIPIPFEVQFSHAI